MERVLKLNVKTTFKLGFAFFGILMLWQVYNSYCPLILASLIDNNFAEGTFLRDNKNFIVGLIMALDNVVAIFIMPIVGKLSDRTKSKWGKRMPYIVIGMLLTTVVFPFIGLMCYFNKFVGTLIFMLLFLVIMQAYRNPAVSFMPDVTPKPLRSKANGIINLVGYIGGVFATVLGMVFSVKDTMSYEQIQGKVLWPFIITTFVFIGVLIYLVVSINENKLLEETKEDVEYGETLSDTIEVVKHGQKLSKQDFKNFIFIIVALFFWYMSFNSFETFGTTFGKKILGTSGVISLMSTVLSVISILTFVLFSGISNKIGRKKTIAQGICLLIIPLVLIAIISILVPFNSKYGGKLPIYWTIFFVLNAILMGIGWALININSFPMVVEFADSENIGKFTSYYYIASMLAQSITPILIGLIMDTDFGLKALFVYASIMMIIALIVFMMVKEKDVKKKDFVKKSALESLGDIDN